MVSCLRSARLMSADRQRQVFVDLRRLHDTASVANNKTFVVSTRLPAESVISHKRFGTLVEARRFWLERVTKLEDTGLQRHDIPIMGFHEED